MQLNYVFFFNTTNQTISVNWFRRFWFKNKKTGETIGTLSSWGMHPEGFGSKFPQISSDFVHYYREAMENGLSGEGGFKGFGGKAVYFTGPVGGLMTQLNINILDRFGQSNGPDSKSQAQGENLAILAAKALNESQKNGVEDMSFQGIAFSAKTTSNSDLSLS